jgi:pyruvate,water dikinase
MKYILFFSQISMKDLESVGGKNASLGEMFNCLKASGIQVPDGFALTADAYRRFCQMNNISASLNELMKQLDGQHYTNLSPIADQARSMILSASMPEDVVADIKEAYRQLSEQCGHYPLDVAVRSSATAEDLPGASFAGRMESFLNIRGEKPLIGAIHQCFASLYTERALKYRNEMGFMNKDIAISVGVQQMVRSDMAASGVAFTIDPDSGFANAIIINGTWGLGENIVQGRVTPDEWIVFKPTLYDHDAFPVIKKHCGKKEFTLVYASSDQSSEHNQTVVNIPTSPERQQQFCLNHQEVIRLAQWCYTIEQHYGRPMDIEWARDGQDQQLYIVQARPETVHSGRKKQVRKIYRLRQTGRLLTSGIGLGDAIASGKARILYDPQQGDQLMPGEILVTDITNPDWDPVLKKAAAIVTNKGGRTSHAAIVARELGTVAVVGCDNATEVISTGSWITVSCAEGNEGRVYDGNLSWEVEEEDLSALPEPRTAPMLILADPDRAFELSHYPCRGVGLLRIEFAIANTIKIHPLALLHPEKITDPDVVRQINELTQGFAEKKMYFVEKLAEAVAMVAAAFYPHDVIVRMSDFKSNEYANLLGGKFFEPDEENPMLGLRGASRYYSPFYREGFALECEAMKKVRSQMKLTNVKLMIPFCRTVSEAKKVLNEMAAHGLHRNQDGLEIYMMVEIPSNVLLADEFARLFDGFSIGSNDLTQLTLGLDRDSAYVSHLFNEEDEAVCKLIGETIRAARRNHIKVGLCGQAPSDIPSFTAFLIREGIDSISFNPDALFKGIKLMLEAEKAYGITPDKFT